MECVKYKSLENATSSTGFKYEIGIMTVIRGTTSESVIIIYPLHTDLGYEFYINNNQIDWETYAENAALIPDDIKEKADLLIKV
jgi:hypothetical protein